jgi:T5SS/PEP-CTERM-associated repeat protein
MRHYILSQNRRRLAGSNHDRRYHLRIPARCLAKIILSALWAGILVSRVTAAVTLDGDVLLYAMRDSPMYYGENPFTAVNDGIPLTGNIIEGFRPFGQQVRFEGRLDDLGDTNPANDVNVNFHIIVGRAGPGQLSILAGSDLRDMDLVIGDSAEINDELRLGTGIVRIDGEGSLYNNDPELSPFFPPPDFDPDNPTSPSVNPRADEPDAEEGFDLWVGRGGTGTLQITAGGRAEIQDTVIIGDQGQATGTISVDGVNSFLGTGRFPEPPGSGTEIQQYGGMIVGRLGTGVMRITNGGQVVAMGRQRQSNRPAIAGVIGSNPFDFQGGDNDDPESGGNGVVTVDGAGSKWIVGGTLQVGGFHNSEFMSLADVKGIGALYSTNVGRGTLNVANDGLVNLVFPTDGAASSNELFAFAIGRFGRVNLGGELGGGRILLSGGFETTGGGTDPDPLLANSHVINDGLITGDGYIGTGRLLNRALGEIHIGVGQSMVIDARGLAGLIDNTMVAPFQNFGVVRAVGSDTGRADIEFIGASIPPSSPLFNDMKFLNGRLNTMEITDRLNNGRTAGLIHAQHGTLRFRSGLLNQGIMAFTAGDNIVSGHTTNLRSGSSGMAAVAQGVITIAGNGTTVTFEDDLINDGIISVDPGTDLIVLGSFGGIGTVAMAFSNTLTDSIGHISVAGNAFLGGTLVVSLGSNPPTFVDGDEFEILSTAGQLGAFTNHFLPDPDGVGPLGMFPVYNTAAGTLTLRVGTGGPMFLPGDYNNDGKVDAADYVLWRSGGPLQNDPTPGVQTTDYDVWRINFGRMSMPGSAAAVAVPEPACLTLMLCLGAMARLRRRSRC